MVVEARKVLIENCELSKSSYNAELNLVCFRIESFNKLSC